MSKWNSLEMSKVLSRSLSHDLSRDEEKELQDQMSSQDDAQAEMAKSFAEWSHAISKSAAWSRDHSDQEKDGLSEFSKERMRKSLKDAKRDLLSSSQTMDVADYARAVADPAETYATGHSATHEDLASSSGDFSYDATQPSEDSRQAVSRFTLLKKIGEGGLGTVWLARDEYLRRNVAIKELNASAAREKRQWDRFRREAEITGHLEHPNVVPLYMSGVNPETRRPFYAMRFLGKQTLSEADSRLSC